MVIAFRRVLLMLRLASGHPAVQLAGIALVSAVLVFLSYAFTREAGRVASIWPLNAFVLALLLHYPAQRWISVLAAAFSANMAVNLLMQDALITGALLAVVNAIETYVCLRLLHRSNEPFDIARGAVLVRFIAVAGIVGPAISATLASSVLVWTQPLEASFAAWYIADALGLLIFTPALLAFGAASSGRMRRAPLWHDLVDLTILLAVLIGVFAQNRYPILFLIPPVMVLATFSQGIRGAGIGVLVTAFVAISFTVAGHGPGMLVRGSDADRVILIQAFLALNTLSTLPIAAALAERDRGRVALEQAKASAEQSMARAVTSETHYRTLAEYSTDIVVRFGPGGVISYASPACRILGISPEHAVGRRTYDFAAPESREFAKQTVEDLFNGEEPDRTPRREFSVSRPDNSVMWLEGSPNVIRGETGAPIEVVSTYRDVTARKLLEVELAEARYAAEAAAAAAQASELRYRMMADGSIDMIARMEMGGKLRFLSRSCMQVLGYTPEEMIGTKTLDRTHPDDVPGVVAFFDDLVRQGPNAAPKSFQYRAIHKSGRHVWLEGNPRIIFNASGKPVEIQDSARDITHRKELEQDLAAAQREALSAAAAKAEFLANMSHELRTPLNSIIGFSRLLAESTGLSDIDRRYSEIVSTSSEGLLRLVNDVLDFSSLEVGRVILERRAFALDAALSRCLDSIRLEADRKGLTLSLVVEGPLVSRHFGDEMRINQIALNLASNAVKFTESGSVTIRVKASPRKALQQSVLIEVEDTGIGIPQDKLPALFGRFVQVDSSINRRFGGSGLGLAISRHLAERMGGRIGVRSIEGRGSTFWLELSLDVHLETAVDPSVVQPVTVSQALGLRILVVDDVDLNRELIVAHLAASQHVVETAADGTVAVEMIKRQPYDLVFMDVQMPGLNGLDATRMVRQIDGRKGTPVIALTAQALASQIEACLAAGMNDHLAKPFRLEALLAAIDKWRPRAEKPSSLAIGAIAVDDLRLRFLQRTRDDYERLRTLRDAPSENAKEELAFMVHRIAGTAGMFGFGDVGEVAGRLDAKIGEGERVIAADIDPLVFAVDAMLKSA